MTRRLAGEEFGAVVRRGERMLSCDLADDGVWALAFDAGIGEPLPDEGWWQCWVSMAPCAGASVVRWRTDHGSLRGGSNPPKTSGFWPHNSCQLSEWDFTTGAERPTSFPARCGSERRYAGLVTAAHGLRVARRLIEVRRGGHLPGASLGPERWPIPARRFALAAVEHCRPSVELEQHLDGSLGSCARVCCRRPS